MTLPTRRRRPRVRAVSSILVSEAVTDPGAGSRSDAASPPIPAPGPPRTLLLGVPRRGRRWPGALRAAAAVALPGLAGLALGHGPVAATAALGAFAVVYGEGRAYRARWQVVMVVAAVLVALAGLGAGVGTLVHSGSEWTWLLLVAVMTAVVAVGAFLVDALRFGAPGAFLPLLTLEIAAALPSAGVPVGAVVSWTAAGAGTAVVVSMSGALARPRAPERAAVAAAVEAVDACLRAPAETGPRHEAVRALHAAWMCLHDGRLGGGAHPLTRTLRAAHLRLATVVAGTDEGAASETDDLRPQPPLPRPSARYRLARAARPGSRSWTIVLRLVVAGPVAGALALACDVGRPDWAVITAAMVLHQGPDRVLGSYRGLHRFAGTVVGLGVLAAVVWAAPTAVALVVVVAVLLAGTEEYLVRNYGVAMVFITPLALLLGGAGVPHDFAVVARDRLLETVIGVLVAVAVLWVVLPFAHRRVLRCADARVAETVATIVQARTAGERTVLPELRRDLEFDLHAATTAAIVAAHTEPGWTRDRWPEHRRLHETGYRVLAHPA